MPNAVQLAGWLGCLFFVVALVNSGMKLVDRLRGHPPVEQLNLQMRNDHAALQHRLAELEKISVEAVSRRRAMYAKMEGTEARLSSELRAISGTMQEQLGHVREEVSALKTETDNQNRHLTHIESKLDRFIEKDRYPR